MNSVTFKLYQPNINLGHGTFLSSTLVTWVRTTSSWVLPPVSLVLKHIPRASPTGNGASGGSFCPFGIHGTPKKTAELMWMWKFHEIHHVFFCFASCIFLFFVAIYIEGESSHGLFCCVWLPVFTVMIYYDIYWYTTCVDCFGTYSIYLSICVFSEDHPNWQLSWMLQVEMAMPLCRSFFCGRLTSFQPGLLHPIVGEGNYRR